jgi:hypothetical protein
MPGTLMPAGFPNVAVVQQTATPGVPGTVLTTSNKNRITTNTTTTPIASTVRLRQITINVTGTPSAWVITIQDKAGTPFVVFSQTFNAATTAPIVVNLGDGITMTNGIDIISSGTTPGVANVALNW